jgi:excisionase family DNA binding protein
MTALGRHLTIRETADLMGVSEPYVRRLCKTGRLEAVRLGDRVLMVSVRSVKTFKRQPRGRPRKKAPKGK